MKHRASGSGGADAFALNCEVYLLGDKAFREGKISTAKKYFKVALEYCPEDCDSWWALGSCYEEINKPQRAEECFRKALEYADEESEANICFNLGNCLYDQEKYKSALDFYQRVPEGSTVWRQTVKNIALATEILNPEHN